MSIYKLAPASVVESSAAQDVQTLMHTDESLIAGSKYLFSCSPAHPSIIVSGKNAGTPLADVLADDENRPLGSAADKYQGVPFSIRKLQPAENEIIYSPAKLHEAFWYVTDAASDAHMNIAKKGALPQSAIEEALVNGTWQTLLQAVPVEEGDIFAMEPGISYCLPHGSSVLEIETNVSTENARVPEKADFHEEDYIADGQGECAIAGQNGVVEFDLYRLDGRLDLKGDKRTCKVIVFLHGNAVVDDHDEETIHAQPDTVLFMPAGEDTIHITGNCAFALVHLV